MARSQRHAWCRNAMLQLVRGCRQIDVTVIWFARHLHVVNFEAA